MDKVKGWRDKENFPLKRANIKRDRKYETTEDRARKSVYI